MDYGNNRSSFVKVLLLIVIAVIIFFFVKEHVGRRSIAGIGEPVQTEASGSAKMNLDGYDITVTYKYSYNIAALVVSTHDYAENDIGDKLAPTDVALAWGKVAALNGSVDFHWSHSGRFIRWSLPSSEELAKVGSEAEVDHSVSNNHLIAANESIKKRIKKIKEGDYIRIKGYLVNVDGVKSDGTSFYWYSSTSRDDTGDGACEVIYVTDVEWLD